MVNKDKSAVFFSSNCDEQVKQEFRHELKQKLCLTNTWDYQLWLGDHLLRLLILWQQE